MHAPLHHDDDFGLKELGILVLLIVLSWSIVIGIVFAIVQLVLAIFPKPNRGTDMTIGFIFWLLMLLWLIFGIWSSYGTSINWPIVGGSLFAFVLFFLLGWKVFGWPIAG
jgi:hypothetical protein